MIGVLGYVSQHALTTVTATAALAAAGAGVRIARDTRLTRRVVLGESPIEEDDGLLGSVRAAENRLDTVSERSDANRRAIQEHERALRREDILPAPDGGETPAEGESDE